MIAILFVACAHNAHAIADAVQEKRIKVNYRQDETKPSIALALSILNLRSRCTEERRKSSQRKYDKDVEMLKLMADTTRTFHWKRSTGRIEKFEAKIMAIWTHDLFITVQCDAIDCSTRNHLSLLSLVFFLSLLIFTSISLHLHGWTLFVVVCRLPWEIFIVRADNQMPQFGWMQAETRKIRSHSIFHSIIVSSS